MYIFVFGIKSQAKRFEWAIQKNIVLLCTQFADIRRHLSVNIIFKSAARTWGPCSWYGGENKTATTYTLRFIHSLPLLLSIQSVPNNECLNRLNNFFFLRSLFIHFIRGQTEWEIGRKKKQSKSWAQLCKLIRIHLYSIIICIYIWYIYRCCVYCWM